MTGLILNVSKFSHISRPCLTCCTGFSMAAVKLLDCSQLSASASVCDQLSSPTLSFLSYDKLRTISAHTTKHIFLLKWNVTWLQNI